MTADERREGQGSEGLLDEVLPTIDLTGQRVRQRRRVRLSPTATVVLSAIAGAVTGYLLFTGGGPGLPRQELAGIASSPSANAAPTDVADRDVAGSTKGDEARHAKRKHDTVVLGKQLRRKESTVTPETTGGTQPQAPADGHHKRKKRDKLQGSQTVTLEQKPSVTLYHLYRKRDRRHAYTTSGPTAQNMKDSDGYKDRLSPGLVFTEPREGTVLVPVNTYYQDVQLYVYAEDEGEDTVPLYHLTGRAGREMVTSWEPIRDAWIDKGWTLQGTVGFIYRPN